MSFVNRGAAAAAAVACALGLAACGGSDGGDASADGGGKPPIKIMAMGPIDAAAFSVPSIKVGAEVGVDELNAAGGVDGRKVQLVACNDGNDPNRATGCARQAIKQKVAAIVGGFTSFEPQVVPIVERAGIPWIGPTALQNSTSKSYYLLGGEGATLAFAMGLHLDQQKCRSSVAVGENVPSVKAAVQLFQLGVAAGKGHYGGAVYGASNAADWAPVIAAGVGKGADCMGILASTTTSPKAAAAIAQSGKDIEVAAPLSLLPGQAIAALGKAADGIALTSGYLPFSSDAPAVVALKKAAQAKDPKVPLDSILESTYAGVKVFGEAAKGQGDVTAASVGKALDGMSGYDTGLGPVVDFTKANPAKLFTRVVNTKVYVLEAKGGEIVQAEAEPIDTAPAFVALAAAGK